MKILFKIFLIVLLSISFYSLLQEKNVDVNLKNIKIPDNIDTYIREKEETYINITDGAEKKVFWFKKPGIKTETSIVYIHGFSATRKELSPVFENLAKALNANIYFTRLKGHGRGTEALSEATIQGWVDDISESVAIGKKIGRKTILAGTSTGASLALWYASKTDGISKMVIISPNLMPSNPFTKLLLTPLKNFILKISLGDYRNYETENELHKKYSTSNYRSEVLITMMEAVKLAKDSDPGSIEIPVLFLYTENDELISIGALKKYFKKIGSESKKLVNIEKARDHVIAGDMVSPETTDEVTGIILDFLKNE